MKASLALPLLAAFLLLPISAAYAASGSGGATGTVTISGTCGISLNGTTINYGTAAPGQSVNATNVIAVNNTGSVPAALVVSAGNWTSGKSTVIYANETFVSNSTMIRLSQLNPTGPHLALNGAPVTLSFALAPKTPINTFWALIADLLKPFAGALSQTVTYTTSC